MKKDIIIVAGNGPSSQSQLVSTWPPISLGCQLSIYRTNYFFEPRADALDYMVSDWFICQHDPADLRAYRAAIVMARGGLEDVTFWIPGLEERSLDVDEVCKRLGGARVAIQKDFPYLPQMCRWDQDLAPERPLMGSFALAVAVGRQPKELYICGHDLFMHPSKKNHGLMEYNTRSWQDDFVRDYLSNRHRNHTLRGDIKYIRAALSAYQGELHCVGTVMKNLFEDEFPHWEWKDG